MITERYHVILSAALSAAVACVGGGSNGQSPQPGGNAGAAADSGSSGAGGASDNATHGSGGGAAKPGTGSSGMGGTGASMGTGGSTSGSDDAGASMPATGQDGGGSGGSGAGSMPLTAGAPDSHFPLVDGATWVYHHTKPNKPAWDESDSMQASMYMGKPAFDFHDQEDSQGVQTNSTLAVDGTGIYRVYQEQSVSGQVAVTVSYDPAFLRFDEAWTKKGQSVTLTDGWTQTCVVGGTAASNCASGAVTPGMTTHKYTVVDPAAKVTVPAGTFDAVEIERVDPNTNETKRYWFAAGVGKVRDENPASMAVTELTSYMIP